MDRQVLGALLLLATGVAAGPHSMSFLAIGDWGGHDDSDPTSKGELDNSQGMASVAGKLGDNQFVLALGDNFYSSGIHGDDHSSRFKNTFENVFTQSELQVPWYAVAGNHDHLGNVTAQIAYSQDSKRWNFPSLYYTFSKNFTGASGKKVSTQIVYIDTVVMLGMSYHDEVTGEFVKPKGPAPEHVGLAATQLEWLKETLQASKADYLWVAGHYPVYSICEHGPTLKLILQVLPLLKQYKASGYIAGHDHCLNHFDHDGLSFVLSGAGRECCYSPKHKGSEPSGSLKFHMDGSQTYGADGGFASFTVTETETTIKYYDSTGRVLYTADPVKPRNV